MSRNSAAIPVPAFIFRGHVAAIHALEFIGSNSYLVSGDSDGWIVIWSLATKRAVAVWKGHEGGLMKFHEWTSERLISHGRDHILRVWQLRPQDFDHLNTKLPADGVTGETYPQPWLLYSMAANALNYCAFDVCEDIIAERQDVFDDSGTPTSTASPLLIATPNGLDTGGVDIFHLPLQKRVYKVPSDKDTQKGMVMAVSILRHPILNQIVLIAGYESGDINIRINTGIKATNEWTWTVVLECRPHTQPVLSLDATEDGAFFLSSSADAVIAKVVIPLSPEKTNDLSEKTINTKHAGQQDITIRDDEKIFATAGWDKRIRVYSTKTMKELAVLKWHQEGCYSVSFTRTRTEKIGDLPEKETEDKSVLNLINHDRNTKSQSTHWLAAGGKDGKISLWDVY